MFKKDNKSGGDTQSTSPTTNNFEMEKKNNLFIDKELQKFINENFELIENIYIKKYTTIFKVYYKKNNINKLFALKIIKKEQKKKSLQSNEISIQQKLKHYSISNLLGYYDLPSCSTLIYDFQKYGDLHQFQILFLKRKFLSETFLSYLTSQILEALKYLHQNKILHLDIKQKNILVSEFMQFKLIDFSISLDYRDKNYITLPLAGTYGYMSPEVLNRKKIAAKDASKVDIFSFGALLYFSAFGIFPYNIHELNDKDYDKMNEYIEKNELIFPEGFHFSDKFKNFLKKCLEKNIDERYDIYNIFNDEWVKGGEIIKEYKEKLCNTNIFLINTISDNILEFDKYLKSF